MRNYYNDSVVFWVREYSNWWNGDVNGDFYIRNMIQKSCYSASVINDKTRYSHEDFTVYD